MKKYIFLIIFMSFVFFFSYTRSAIAQDNQTYLIYATYHNRDDIDFLYDNSTIVMQYFETEQDGAVFIATTTRAQKDAIDDKKLLKKTIDTDPQAGRYALYMYSNKDDIAILHNEGGVIELTREYVIVKYPQDTLPKTPDQLGGSIVQIPLFESIPTPLYRSATITIAPEIMDKATKTTLPSDQTKQKSDNTITIVIIISILALIITVLVVYYWVKRKE